MIVFRAELEIAEQDRSLSASDDEDNHHEEQEPEDQVDLMEPERRHDEIQLHGNSSEGKDPAEHAKDDWTHVPGLERNRPRDLIGSHREGEGLSFVSKETSQKHQWSTDAEPEKQQGEERPERYRARGALEPENEV